MNHLISSEHAYNPFFNEYPDVLTTKDVQTILGISNKTLLKLLHTEKIKYIKIGRTFRIPKLYLLQYLGLIPDESYNLLPQNRHSM